MALEDVRESYALYMLVCITDLLLFVRTGFFYVTALTVLELSL